VRVKKSFEVFYGRLEFFNSELLECKLVEFRIDEGIFEILIEVLLLFSNILSKELCSVHLHTQKGVMPVGLFLGVENITDFHVEFRGPRV
jgi:hypothetical protein